MSYIRSLSNPEGLYIYCSRDGIMCYGDGGPLCFSEKDFRRIGLAYLDFGDLPLRSGGLVLSEVSVFSKTGREVPKNHRCPSAMEAMRRAAKKGDAAFMRALHQCPHDYKIKLSFRGKAIYMWRVTWDYIAHSIQGHVKVRKKPQR